jgi:hypothetical protein
MRYMPDAGLVPSWLLDHLDWRPWPKDPGWSYSDIDGFVRISRRGFLYSVRVFSPGDEPGKPTGPRFSDVNRLRLDEVLTLLAEEHGFDGSAYRGWSATTD